MRKCGSQPIRFFMTSMSCGHGCTPGHTLVCVSMGVHVHRRGATLSFTLPKICFLVKCMWEGACAHESQCPRVQKRASDSLELALQEVVNHLMWMLGTELRSVGSMCSYPLNHPFVFSPATSPISDLWRLLSCRDVLVVTRRCAWPWMCSMDRLCNGSTIRMATESCNY